MAVGIGEVAAVFAFVVSAVTLYLTHLRGADITPSVEEANVMIEELNVKALKEDIPTNLKGKTSIFVINKGTRTGAIKFTDVVFTPIDGFRNFFESYQPILSSANQDFGNEEPCGKPQGISQIISIASNPLSVYLVFLCISPLSSSLPSPLQSQYNIHLSKTPLPIIPSLSPASS